jgi:hypothetical protein
MFRYRDERKRTRVSTQCDYSIIMNTGIAHVKTTGPWAMAGPDLSGGPTVLILKLLVLSLSNSHLVSATSAPALSLTCTMERVKQLASHFVGSSAGVAALERKHPDDIVITMAIRSPLCKAKKGGFKDMRHVSTGRDTHNHIEKPTPM